MSDLIHISRAGPFQWIMVGKRKWHFEMHNYFGPIALNNDGGPMKRPPGEHNPFWRAVWLWDRQGRRMTVGDVCVWEPTP